MEESDNTILDSKKKNLIKKILGKFSQKQARMGIAVEQEHKGTTKGSQTMMAGIARDHLKEFPDYYTRLEKMENEAKK